MRRTGYTGDIWPDDVEELLLRAALVDGRPGVQAWSAVRPRIDVDDLPGERHRLIPLLSRALPANGATDPDLRRLQGVYQFTWYRNTTAGTAVSGLLRDLEQSGVRTMLLRGAAVMAAHHRDAGLRPMNDLDILVRAHDLDAAMRLAVAAGWYQLPQFRHLERRWRSVWLGNEQGHRVCLHRAPTAVLSYGPEAQDELWARSVEATLYEAPTRVPSAADHLLLVVVDGARAGSLAHLRWITDAAALIGNGIDWRVLLTEAGRHAVTGQVAEALRYLRTALDVDIPVDVLTSLFASHTGPRARLAHRLSVVTTPGLPAGAEVLGRFVRLTADVPLRRAAAAVPGYLADQCGVERPSEVPAAVARRVRGVRSLSAARIRSAPTVTQAQMPRSAARKSS